MIHGGADSGRVFDADVIETTFARAPQKGDGGDALSLEQVIGAVIGDDAPIAGLFACGELVGGVFFNGYPGGSGLTSGTVFGRRAGYGAAAYVRGA